MRAHERGDKKTRTGAEEGENRCVCVCVRAHVCVGKEGKKERPVCERVSA